MKLQSIRVEGFKRFRDPLTIGELLPGINLIAAPNGKGKSTIAEAVRVAFLERHKTASLGDSLAPWTQPGANPSVQIQFERQGKVHRLSKTFGSKKSCSLAVEGGASLTGDEAEQHLAQMLAFRLSSKGASKAEHHGVPGLLWVQQGTSGQIVMEVDSAHEYISRALGDDFGELAATAGDRVIQRVEEELGVLHTKTGKPTGEFARMMDGLAGRQAELEAVRVRVRTYTADVDRFSLLQAQHGEGERERIWEAQRHEANQIRERLQSLEHVVNRHQQTKLQLAVTESDIVRLQAELGKFDEEDAAVTARQVDLGAAKEREGRTAAEVRTANDALNAAREADAAARTQAAAARRAATRMSHAQALEAAKRRRQELDGHLKTIEGHLEELAQKQSAKARLAGFAGADKKLRAKESKLATARAQLDAASTRLEYALHADGVTLAGAPISGNGARTIAEPAEITIEGIGSIRVLPGAKDLTQLRADLERAEQDLAVLLSGLGVSSAQDALAREQDLGDAESAINRLNAIIEGIAPTGIDALRDQVNEAQGDVERHEQALDNMPAADPPGEEISVQAAEAREVITHAALKKAQEAHDNARAAAVALQEQVRLATREHEAAQARASVAGRDEQRTRLRAELTSAEARQETQQGEMNTLAQQIEVARPDLLQSDVVRLTRSAEALEVEHGRVKAQLDVLAGELKAQGALGLQEEEAALHEEVASLQRQVDDRTRRAAALTHLLKVLNQKRADVARSIRAPLQKHMNHYMAIQFPGASIELDEGMRPQRITRPGQFGTETGAFEELSGGEREQVGVIARLAYADLLKESGKPTLVMLDDSLVNCDRDRLAQMKRVIYDAAERHQIIIFTCHQELWLDLGVAPRSLQ